MVRKEATGTPAIPQFRGIRNLEFDFYQPNIPMSEDEYLRNTAETAKNALAYATASKPVEYTRKLHEILDGEPGTINVDVGMVEALYWASLLAPRGRESMSGRRYITVNDIYPHIIDGEWAAFIPCEEFYLRGNWDRRLYYSHDRIFEYYVQHPNKRNGFNHIPNELVLKATLNSQGFNYSSWTLRRDVRPPVPEVAKSPAPEVTNNIYERENMLKAVDPDDPSLITLMEAAELLGETRNTVYSRIRTQTLPIGKVGKRHYYSRDEVLKIAGQKPKMRPDDPQPYTD